MTAARQSDADERLWADALARMTARVRETAAAPLGGFPHYADPSTGAWTTTADGFWTGGFWVGELWLAGHYAADRALSHAAEAWLRRLSARIHSRSVFRGFLFYYGAVPGAALANNAYARDTAIRAAQAVAQSFDPVAGLIPLGAEAEEAHTVGNNESNIDGLIASPLLLWAANAAGDANLRKIALAHADRNAEFCVQGDGSVIQSASLDPSSGRVVRRYTHKGYAPTSIWTRAQAWAMLGYALCAGLAPAEKRLLAYADQTAQWWIDNSPGDRVAYWDFSVPKTAETKRDTSGTAIAAASLLKLSAVHPDRDKAAQYAQAGKETARALVQRHLTPLGILADGCFDPNHNTAVANELIWGDYFLFEALGALSGRLPPRVL